MAAAASGDGSLLAMIVDADTATGLLLTGVGQVDIRKRSNFLIVDDSECAAAAAAGSRHLQQPLRLCCSGGRVPPVCSKHILSSNLRALIASAAALPCRTRAVRRDQPGADRGGVPGVHQPGGCGSAAHQSGQSTAAHKLAKTGTLWLPVLIRT